MKEKIALVFGGLDWADASVESVMVPANLDLDDLLAEYKKAGGYSFFKMFFADWLCKHKGGRNPTEDELDEVWET
jgi:hypothetical protein